MDNVVNCECEKTVRLADKKMARFRGVEITGFGLRVRRSGRKSYVVQTRIAGKLCWFTIGPHGPLNPDQARARALEILACAKKGIDPRDADARRKAEPSMADLGRRFLEQYVPVHCKPSTREEYRRSVRLFVDPVIGELRVPEVQRKDIAALHHGLRDKPYQANRRLGVLSKMFNLAEVWGWRPDGSNPCRHVKRYKEHKRERFLSPQETERLGQVLREAEEEMPSAVAAFRLLLLTGCRMSEIRDLRWDYVKGDCIELPDAKTGWAVGDSGTILATGDGGATWAPQTSGTQSHLSAVQFLDAETGWAVGDSGTILATGDGGATWAPQTSGTRSNLYAVQFLDAKTGWAVGNSGQMVKIEAPDVFTYADIASDAALKQALTQMPPDGIVDPAPFLASLEAIEKNRDLETSIRIALQSQITGTEAGGVSVFGQKFDLTLNITRVGLVALILFLVGVFSGLYRYNLRMAAFYDSRADALVMHWSHDSDHTLAELADIFGPDSIEFAKARLPTEHIINLAKQAIKSRAKT